MPRVQVILQVTSENSTDISLGTLSVAELVGTLLLVVHHHLATCHHAWLIHCHCAYMYISAGGLRRLMHALLICARSYQRTR